MGRRKLWIAAIGAIALAGLAFIARGTWKAITLAQAYNGAANISPQGGIDPEEYAVYSAVIESDFINDAVELVVVDRQTDLGYPSDNGPTAWDFKPSTEVWQDFLAKDKEHLSLMDNLDLSRPYLLVAEEERSDVHARLSLAGVQSTPFLQFSRVGLNPDRDEAVVHVTVAILSRTRPAIEFAFGVLLYLRKVNGIWAIQVRQDTFIT